MFMKPTPEFQLLCASARAPWLADNGALSEIIVSGLNWNLLLRGAEQHQVTPLLFSALQSSGSPLIPKPVLKQLHQRTMLEVCRSLAQVGEIARLSSIFSRMGINVLLLKGVALSLQLYGNPYTRGGRDIDFLVNGTQADAAEKVLKESGYTAQRDDLLPGQKHVYRTHVKEAEFVNPKMNVCLELHHRLTDNPVLLPWDYDVLWKEREELQLTEANVATLPRAMLPLYLCVHGAMHGWERLRWILDFAVLLDKTPDISTVIAKAREAGLGSVMHQAIVLSQNLIGLPRANISLMPRRPAAIWLDLTLDKLLADSVSLNPPQPGTLRWRYRYSVLMRLYRLAVMPNWAYWKQEMLREWVSPADWHLVRLPTSLFWLYPIIRPVGWLLRSLKDRR